MSLSFIVSGLGKKRRITRNIPYAMGVGNLPLVASGPSPVLSTLVYFVLVPDRPRLCSPALVTSSWKVAVFWHMAWQFWRFEPAGTGAAGAGQTESHGRIVHANVGISGEMDEAEDVIK